MAPEYGATLAYFAVDELTLRYLRDTGRSAGAVDIIEAYFRAQAMFGVPMPDEIDYSQTITLDLATVQTSVSGPSQPQDRANLRDVAALGLRCVF